MNTRITTTNNNGDYESADLRRNLSGDRRCYCPHYKRQGFFVDTYYAYGFIAWANSKGKQVTVYYVDGYDEKLKLFGLDQNKINLDDGEYTIVCKSVSKQAFDEIYGKRFYSDKRKAELEPVQSIELKELKKK